MRSWLNISVGSNNCRIANWRRTGWWKEKSWLLCIHVMSCRHADMPHSSVTSQSFENTLLTLFLIMCCSRSSLKRNNYGENLKNEMKRVKETYAPDILLERWCYFEERIEKKTKETNVDFSAKIGGSYWSRVLSCSLITHYLWELQPFIFFREIFLFNLF